MCTKVCGLPLTNMYRITIDVMKSVLNYNDIYWNIVSLVIKSGILKRSYVQKSVMFVIYYEKCHL